jgi:hydroxyacylglutathione hydrolase
MKRDNKAGPTLLPDGKLPQPRRLQSDEVAARVAAGNVIFLDLRSDRKSFMKQHLTGSLFAPLTGGKLPIVAGSYVEENSPIILLVNDADEVDQAVRELVRIGLDKIEGWVCASEALAVPGVTSHQKSITTAELAGHSDAVVLDVRGASEFAEGHVRGAKNIAYTRLAARLDEVPDAHPLYVHCGSGLRASFAVPYLVSKNHEVVYVDGPFSEIPDWIKS